MFFSEPGLGFRNRCFDKWLKKLDITQSVSVVEMAYAFGNGNRCAGEVLFTLPQQITSRTASPFLACTCTCHFLSADNSQQ